VEDKIFKSTWLPKQCSCFTPNMKLEFLMRAYLLYGLRLYTFKASEAFIIVFLVNVSYLQSTCVLMVSLTPWKWLQRYRCHLGFDKWTLAFV